MTWVRRLGSATARALARAVRVVWSFATRHVVAAVTTAAAAIGTFLADSPVGSVVAFPVGVIAREIERAQTSDLRRRAQQVTADAVRAALDTRLELRALEHFLFREQLPQIREFANLDDVGRVGATFRISRDGYQLAAQLHRLHGWVAGATGGDVAHLSTRDQRARSRFLDALAIASQAASDMTLAEGERAYAGTRSYDREPNPTAAEAAESRRNDACARLRQAVRDALATEAELARP